MMSLHEWLNSPWVLRRGWTLVHSQWQVLAVVVVLAAIVPPVRRRGPRAAYAACGFALTLCLFVPAITFLFIDVAATNRTSAPVVLGSLPVDVMIDPQVIDAQEVQRPSVGSLAPASGERARERGPIHGRPSLAFSRPQMPPHAIPKQTPPPRNHFPRENRRPIGPPTISSRLASRITVDECLELR